MTGRRRWLLNLGIALALCLAVPVVVALSAIANDTVSGNPVHLDFVRLAVLEGIWIAVLVVVPVVLYLAVGELVWRRVAPRRLVAVLLGAVVLSAFVLGSQGDQLASVTLAPGLLVIPAIGGLYGALIRLPGREARRSAAAG